MDITCARSHHPSPWHSFKILIFCLYCSQNVHLYVWMIPELAFEWLKRSLNNSLPLLFLLDHMHENIVSSYLLSLSLPLPLTCVSLSWRWKGAFSSIWTLIEAEKLFRALRLKNSKTWICLYVKKIVEISRYCYRCMANYKNFNSAILEGKILIFREHFRLF